MNPFDMIIGYDAVKYELIRMADVLAHPEVYPALGVSVPRGLLLHGDPDVGKTLMVKCLTVPVAYRHSLVDETFLTAISF